MKKGRVMWIEKGVVVASDVLMAESAIERMRGLIGRPALAPGEGLWIEPCSSVHTFGMPADLDLVFLAKGAEVVKLKKRIRPFRLSWAIKASATLELWPGAIEETRLNFGATLRFEEDAA